MKKTSKAALSIALIAGAGLMTNPSFAQKTADGYDILPSGLQFKLFARGTGNLKPKLNDHVEMNIRVSIGDSTMFDSRKVNNNKPVPFQLKQPNFKGDPVEGFMLMVEGDSALMRLPVDSISKQGKPMMPGMKEGDILQYQVKMVTVRTDAEFNKEAAEKTEMQKAIDEALLKGYLEKNKIKATKTNTGLYYAIEKKGAGAGPKKGDKVTVNYTGKLIDGKKFDSNTDPEFHHTEPFSVEVGMGRVIKGWDEGLMLLPKGTKATLYIPSGLAYGSQDKSPQIPANSVLIFDVEIVDVATPGAADEKLITKYLADHKVKATKTPSGLYYKITKEGKGEKPHPGQKVVVNYTGMTLDGKKFDSNMDSAFHHVSPFSFTLGQGQVIKGWDEGIAMLPKGTKATLYLPSAIAYGAQSPSPAIPANSVLIFDVELVDITK